MTLRLSSLETIHDTAREFLSLVGNSRVFAFNAPMGAGKTTFIKALCEILGVVDIVNSPTFAIVNEYQTGNGSYLYHFDCYRLNSVQEALDLGAEEYLYSGNYCFIEWAERIDQLLPTDAVEVTITPQTDGVRVISIGL